MKRSLLGTTDCAGSAPGRPHPDDAWKADLRLFFESPFSSTSAFLFYYGFVMLILIATASTILETLPAFKGSYVPCQKA